MAVPIGLEYDRRWSIGIGRGPSRRIFEGGRPVPKGLTAVLVQPGKPLELETLPTPEVEPGGILIRNTAAAICGSDALDLLVRTRDKYPLSNVVSHSFPLQEINQAFELAEWQGKNSGTAATRVILKP
jgi:Zn-dependent alcohol dehydrogenase